MLAMIRFEILAKLPYRLFKVKSTIFAFDDVKLVDKTLIARMLFDVTDVLNKLEIVELFAFKFVDIRDGIVAFVEVISDVDILDIFRFDALKLFTLKLSAFKLEIVESVEINEELVRDETEIYDETNEFTEAFVVLKLLTNKLDILAFVFCKFEVEI